jgi:hypothetical protein
MTRAKPQPRKKPPTKRPRKPRAALSSFVERETDEQVERRVRAELGLVPLNHAAGYDGGRCCPKGDERPAYREREPTPTGIVLPGALFGGPDVPIPLPPELATLAAELQRDAAALVATVARLAALAGARRRRRR